MTPAEQAQDAILSALEAFSALCNCFPAGFPAANTVRAMCEAEMVKLNAAYSRLAEEARAA